MRVPLEIARQIHRGASLGFTCEADGAVSCASQAHWGGDAYPPSGYFAWNLLQVGNGDTYGYYWPIGGEEGPPIVCTTMHDCGQLLPCASSLSTCVRLHLLTHNGDTEELVETANEFEVAIDDIAVSAPRDDETAGAASRQAAIEYWGAPSAQKLLSHDPNSPHLRYLLAKEALAERRLDEADEHLEAALSVLPEYAQALALQAQVARQQQKQQRVAELLMEALASPYCFGAPDQRNSPACCSGWTIMPTRAAIHCGNDVVN